MNTKTILGVLVVFFVAVLAQAAFAGTYWYQGQAVYSDPVYRQSYYSYGNNYYGNSGYGNGYNGNSYNDRYYNDGYPEVPYQPSGFYYNVKPYLEGFPDYYYYDYPGTYNIGMGRSYTVYGSGRADDWGYWNNRNVMYDDYQIDSRYYYYPQDGMYFDRYGRRYN